MNGRTLHIAILALFITLISANTSAAFEEEKEQEIVAYVNTFSLPFRMKQHTAAESLAYAGLTDHRIFDEVEKQLLQNYESLSDSYDIDWASWLVKALSFSGESKYLATIKMLQNDAPNRKLRKYAKLASGYSGQYRVWNPIIMSVEDYQEQYSLNINRYANMLRSEEPVLHKLAAKRIFFEGIQEQYISDLVQNRIDHPSPDTDRDTRKWLKKSLCTHCSTFGSRP